VPHEESSLQFQQEAEALGIYSNALFGTLLMVKFFHICAKSGFVSGLLPIGNIKYSLGVKA
jgi:hypothetical protein